MAGTEKAARALLYIVQRDNPEYNVHNYPKSKLTEEAEKAARPVTKPPLGKHGSNNHAAVKAAAAGVVMGDWSQSREFFEVHKRAGLSEWGPLYWLLTCFCVGMMYRYGPKDVQEEAVEFLAFFDELGYRTLVENPRSLELYTLDRKAGHDGRRFHKEKKFMITAGPRGIFNQGLGWQLENLVSSYHFRTGGAQRVKNFRNQKLQFNDNDFGFELSIAYSDIVPRVPGKAKSEHWLRSGIDVIKFKNGDALVVCTSGDHSTKPPINMVDSGNKGVCRLYSAIKYQDDKHVRGSKGTVRVDGNQIWATADGPDGKVVHKSRERKLSDVASWWRLAQKDGWLEIDPATQEPKDDDGGTTTEPPVEPPLDGLTDGAGAFMAAVRAVVAGNKKRAIEMYHRMRRKQNVE
jgi:hypothetical protein